MVTGDGCGVVVGKPVVVGSDQVVVNIVELDNRITQGGGNTIAGERIGQTSNNQLRGL